MTVNSEITPDSYSPDGATTSFTVSNKYLLKADVKATLRSAAGVDTVWTLGTQYTLSAADVDAGGTLTVSTSPTDYTPASGTTLLIDIVPAITQTTGYTDGDAFPASSHEDALDRLTMIAQRVDRRMDKALVAPDTDTGTDYELPNETDRASKYAAYDSAGTPIASDGPTGDSDTPVSSFIGDNLFGAANAAAARTVLGAASLTAAQIFTATQRFTKGGDLTSANPLVVDTDGNYFDVTGTTGFASMTVTAGGLFMTQFDANLTMTDGAALDLGGADIKTVAGDRALWYATADDTVILLAYHSNAGRAPGLPRGSIGGLTLSRDTDTDHDVNVTAGEARDSTNAFDIVLASEITKQIDAAWAVGDDAGGLDGSESVGGTPDSSTWYFVHLIRRNDTGVVDVLFSESATAPTLPTDYDVFRRIGAVLTDGSANVIDFTQTGDEFTWKVQVQDQSATNPGTSAVTETLTVPTGVVIEAILNVHLDLGGEGTIAGLISALSQTDAAPSFSAVPGSNFGAADMGTNDAFSYQVRALTNTSAQVRSRLSASDGTTRLQIYTSSYIDRRGQDD